MITLELGELYGMDSVEDLIEAIKMLKDHMFTDEEIQEMLYRSKKEEEDAETNTFSTD